MVAAFFIDNPYSIRRPGRAKASACSGVGARSRSSWRWRRRGKSWPRPTGLAIGQPALTRAIAALESRFGAPLFERLPTGVRPTALGAVAAEQARRLLRAYEEAEDRIGGALAGRNGHIRATADALWMQGVVVDAVGRFREGFPGIELRLRSAGPGRRAGACWRPGRATCTAAVSMPGNAWLTL